MRILVLHQYFLEDNDPGASRFNEMTKVWSSQGHTVTVLAGMMHYNGHEKYPEYKGIHFKRKMQGPVEVWRCHVSEQYNKSFIGRLWGYFSFVFSSLWAGLTKVKGSYDVILVTSPPLFVGITGVLLSWFKRTPFVFEIRDLWPESAIDTGVVTNKFIIKMAYAFEHFIYRKAKLINVLTPAFRTTLIEKKGVPSEKIVFIPNAADFSLSDELLNTFDAAAFKKELGQENLFVVTYVGAHGVANHLDQLLDTAELLRGEPILIQLIGDGMEKKRLVEEARKRGLDNVLFRDPVPKKEVFKYILASDLGASVLKKVDTFKTIYSNKTFDYMSCQRPILLAIDGVSRELVETAQCGLFVEPENPRSIADGILYYRDHPERRIQDGANGFAYAKNHFDRDVLARRYAEYLSNL
ncbi:glycosyltransferase [bacterium]|nr:glycosyltransferase [bacterium]